MTPTRSHPELIAKLQGAIHDRLKGYVNSDEPVAILDFPDIRNCGDSAIWLGEMAYLKERHGKRPAYVARMREFSKEKLERVMPTGTIFVHGGAISATCGSLIRIFGSACSSSSQTAGSSSSLSQSATRRPSASNRVRG